MVRVMGLHAVALGSNPVLTSGQGLFPVVSDSTLPHFVNSQLIASWQLGFFNDVLSLNCFFCFFFFFQIIKSGVPVN